MNIFKVIQVILVILLVPLVLIQSKGKGLASGIGSSIGSYGSKRGLEKIIFVFTIAVAVFVVVNSLLIVIHS